MTVKQFIGEDQVCVLNAILLCETFKDCRLTYSWCRIRGMIMSVSGGATQFNAFVLPNKGWALPLWVWKAHGCRQLSTHLPLSHYRQIPLLGVRLLELHFVGEEVLKIFSNFMVVFCLAECKDGVDLWVKQASGIECLFKFVQKCCVEIRAKCGLKDKSRNRDWMIDSCQFYLNTAENDLSIDR